MSQPPQKLATELKFRISPAQKKALDRLASAKGKSTSQVIRASIEALIRKHTPKTAK